MSTTSWCPYCNSVQSMLLGHVYCSRQSKSMGELETGTLLIRSRQLEETDDHISRLSIRYTLSGEQHYRVGGHEHLVRPEKFLLVNQGQRYQTSFRSETEQEMILVAFRPGFVEQLYRDMTSPENTLLSDPFAETAAPVRFFEKTYEMDPVVLRIFRQLRKQFDVEAGLRKEADVDALYTALLLRIFKLQLGQYREADKLGSSKKGTRLELFRRLSIARDYMEACTGHPLRLEDIAREACLSVHHFKRGFKDLYGLSPHRFLVNKRIDRAAQLLQQSQLPVEEICQATGFENTSSFIRLFKAQTGHTPGSYRRLKK